jgi:hypothetical protein
MRTILVPLLICTSLVACTPAEDASDEVPVGGTYSLQTAPMYLFSGFEGDVAQLGIAVADLEFAMKDIDLTLSAKDRAFTLEKLTADKLGGAIAPPGTDPANQIATVLLAESIHNLDDNYDLTLEPNYVCIESDTTVFYGRSFTSDTACWADRSCDYLRTTNEVRKENILAKAWYDLKKDYRRIELADGRTALVARSWTEVIFPGDNGNTEFAQNFTAEAWIPTGDTTLHAYAIWTEINLGLGDDAMQTLIIDGLDQGMDFSDEFMSGAAAEDYCPNDRDRAYDRPPAE